MAPCKNLSKRSRSWVFTLNNYTQEEVALLRSNPWRYTGFGFETGEGGTPHLQGVLYDDCKKSLKQLKSTLTRGHFEVQKGSFQQARDYCAKDGQFEEHGVPPKSTKTKISCHTLLTTPISTLVERNEISAYSIPSLSKAQLIYNASLEPLETLTCRGIWIHGFPGTGKSHYARKVLFGPDADYYEKGQNKWWDGYTGQELVLLDDYDSRNVGLAHYLKRWLDKWKQTGEVKGGMVSLRHRYFVITSNYTPMELFGEDDVVLARAVERRCIFKHMRMRLNLRRL